MSLVDHLCYDVQCLFTDCSLFVYLFKLCFQVIAHCELRLRSWFIESPTLLRLIHNMLTTRSLFAHVVFMWCFTYIVRIFVVSWRVIRGRALGHLISMGVRPCQPNVSESAHPVGVWGRLRITHDATCLAQAPDARREFCAQRAAPIKSV